MTLRRSFPPVAVAAALVLAACGGGSSSSPSDADIQRQIDDGLDRILDVADDMATTTVADVVESIPEPEPETEPEVEPDVAPTEARCANVSGDSLTELEFVEVDCDGPHDAELAGIVAAPEGQSPTDETEFDIVLTSACLDTVESLAGQSLQTYGPDATPRSETVPGQSFFGEVECWLHSPTFRSLTGSLREVDLATALGDHVTLGSLEPGDCFLRDADNNGSISVGTIVDCSTNYADQILGVATLDDGPFPGEDALFDAGDELCQAVAAESGLELIGDVTSAIIPFETEWVAYGIHSILCINFRSADVDDGPFCGIQIVGEGYDLAECDEPHQAEFVGAIDPPEGSLPDDAGAAETMLEAHCAPSVSEFLGGRDLSAPGIGVGFVSDIGLGDEFDGPIECWALTGSPIALNASIAEVGLEAAFGDIEILAELEPGTCFTFAPESFDLGFVVTCDTADALMSIGSFDVDDAGPHPGDDALRAIRLERCSEIMATSGLNADPASVSGTFPSESGWDAVGRRTITCDAAPL